MLQTSGKGLGNWLTGLLKIVLIPWIEHRWDLFCPYTVQWLLARARNTNDITIACCECEMFVSLTRLSSTERIFADTSSIFMWSSSLCMSHAHLIFFKYCTVFLYFIVLLLVLVLVAIQAWRCPVGSLSAPIFLTHCLRGLKLITLHSVRTLDALLLGFDTIALISLWLLGNLPSWTWAHDQNFGFSFS